MPDSDSSERLGRAQADPIFGEALCHALDELAGERDPLRVAARLRALFPPGLARRAAELHRLRVRAARKFPGLAPRFLTAKGLEQASSEAVARARAQRIAAAAGQEWVADLTCGIGGDALALTRIGVKLIACDRDPVLVAYARANLCAAGLRARFAVAAAESGAVRAPFLLLDPDRRARGGRSLDPEAWSPPLARALELAAAARGACLKLPPSFDPEALDRRSLGGARARWQWTSLRGELAETCLWTGELAGAAEDGAPLREATRLDGQGGAVSLEGRPLSTAPLEPARARTVRYLCDPDPALVRSGLLGLCAARAGLRPLSAHIAYLGGEHPPQDPLLAVLRVLGSVPLDRRRVRALLAQHGIGPIAVRKRGHPDPAEVLARRMRGPGERHGTLVVARLEDGHQAYLVEALENQASGEEPRLVGDEGFEPPTSSL